MIKTKSKYFYFFLLFFSLSPVFAASESSTFQVGASLISSCEFSITNLSFGNIAASSTGELKFNGNIYCCLKYKKNNFMQEKNELIKLVSDSESLSDVLRKSGKAVSGSSINCLKKKLED